MIFISSQTQNTLSMTIPYGNPLMKVGVRTQEKPISLDTFNKALTLKHHVILWQVIPLTHKEGIVEAYEEIDIVIGDKKIASLRYSYRVHKYGDRNVMQRFYFFASGKIWGIFNMFDHLQMDDMN